jgi:hypothetical protein
MSDQALRKLENVLGAERAKTVTRDTLREIGLETLRTPNDRLRFGEALVHKGGLLEVVGRSIKIQAILHGAKEG